MKNDKSRNFLLVATMASSSILLAAAGGCGGGGGDSTPAPAPATSAGKIVDGYVIGATVCLDLNDDRIFGADEPCVVTGADGSFAFPNLGNHMVRSTGGVDASTNTPFVGELKAPPGATVITPLTSLVVANVEARLPAPVAGAASALPTTELATAEQTFKTRLGIPAEMALSSTDPVKAVQDNPTDAGAAKLMKQNVALQTLMQQTARAVAASTGVTTPTDAQLSAIYKEAAKAVATLATDTTSGTTPIDLSAAPATFASAVVSNTVAQAKTSAAVAAALPAPAATTLTTLAPASVAAVAATTIGNLVKAVADAPATTLAAAANSSAGASNPARTAYVRTALQTVIAQVSPLLRQDVATVNTPSVLQSLASSVVSTLETGNDGGTSADAAASTAATIINQQIAATVAAVPAAAIPTVNPTAIIATQNAAATAVTNAITQATQTVASATTTSLGTTTTTAAATTTTAAATTTTAAPTTTTTAAATTTTATPTTTTTVATTTTTTNGGGATTVVLIGGTFASPVTKDAASGNFNFTDDVTTESFTRINNCEAGDTITFTNVGSNTLVVSNSGSDVYLTVNANGVVSRVIVAGVGSSSQIIGSLNAFNALGKCTASKS